MALILVFGSSLLLLVALFTLKHREIHTGSVLMKGLRDRADRKTVHVLRAAYHGVPELGKVSLRFFFKNVFHHVYVSFPSVVRYCKGKAKRSVDWVKGREVLKKRGQISLFLQNVSKQEK